ncbi:MAG: hypothetical protein IJF78_17405 [Clostridia bacterium]|nr:hypothetical protein [Clostridia bacterium]
MWYDRVGTDHDTAVSSRVRLARNLAGYPFGARLTDEQQKEIIEKVSAVFREQEGWEIADCSGMSDTERASLVEQHIISREFAQRKTPSVLIRNPEKSVYIMVPEEDHIRIQGITAGLDLRTALANVMEAEELLDSALEFAFSEQYGYLTHCPTNLGTGMRASVMLHLPAHGNGIRSLAAQLSQIGLTMRGMTGEGSAADAALCQISNQTTLGMTEDEIIEKMERAVGNIIAAERELRGRISGEALAGLSDKVMRACGTLMFADRIPSKEMLALYSTLRLGSAMKLVSIPVGKLDEALFTCMPNTILAENADAKTTGQRDRIRADKVRSIIGIKNRAEFKAN